MTWIARLFLATAMLVVPSAFGQSMTQVDEAYCAGAGSHTGYCEGYTTGQCFNIASEERASECRKGMYARQARDTGRAQDKQRAEEDRERRQLLATQPLAVGSNQLLGQWRRVASASSRGLLSELTEIVCSQVQGPGPSFEFRPDALVHGGRTVSRMQYRAGPNGVVYAFGEPDMLRQLAFRFDGRDRMSLANCTYARVGVDSAASSASPTPPREVRTAPANTPKVPPPEICRQVLIDRIGDVTVDEARRVIALRFKDSIDGKVPGSSNLRLDARESPCDDRRVYATLYDFDAAGVLRSVTLVWARPAGPPPADIFSERVRTLSMWFTPDPSPTASRWQGTAVRARVILEDRPEREWLLEAYRAPK
jgi:hypothetical protein